jgi:hypothetical protein
MSVILVTIILLIGVLLDYFIFNNNENLFLENVYIEKINSGYMEMQIPSKLFTLYNNVTSELINKEKYVDISTNEKYLSYLIKIDNETKKMYYELYIGKSESSSPPTKIETNIFNVKQILMHSRGTTLHDRELFRGRCAESGRLHLRVCSECDP